MAMFVVKSIHIQISGLVRDLSIGVNETRSQHNVTVQTS